MKKFPLSLIMLIVIVFACKVKSHKKDLLVGKWQKYNEEPPLYLDTNCALKFNSNGWYTSNCCFNLLRSKGSYTVINHIIYIDGESVFNIVKLDEMELVISQHTPRDFDPDEYYKRIQ